jgi:hypothetical protein
MRRLKAKLLSRTEFTRQNHGCWIWTGPKTSRGYGTFCLDGIKHSAHRAAFTIYNGAIPEDYIIHHSCENKACVNPGHLKCITVGAHVRETAKAGKFRGELNRNARHDNRTIASLKCCAAAGFKAEQLSEIFEIPIGYVKDVIAGRRRATG